MHQVGTKKMINTKDISMYKEEDLQNLSREELQDQLAWFENMNINEEIAAIIAHMEFWDEETAAKTISWGLRCMVEGHLQVSNEIDWREREDRWIAEKLMED